MSQTPLLITFLGFPGSGKTYFATQLAEKLPAITLNSDALRLSMFQTLENIEHIRQTERSRLYDDVFGAMDYGARQILLAGHSAIYDAQQTKRHDRKNIEKIASGAAAIPILIWIKTSPATALRRGQEREPRSDSHVYTAATMKMLIDRFDKVTDLPEIDENVIQINGELPFKKQYMTFEEQVRDIRASFQDRATRRGV